MIQAVLKVFFFPGDLVCTFLHAENPDDRAMIRTMVNMLVWNAVVVIAAALIVLK